MSGEAALDPSRYVAPFLGARGISARNGPKARDCPNERDALAPGPRCAQPEPPPAMPQAPQVPAPPVAWNTLLNTKVEPVSRVTKSISTPAR